MSVSTPYEATGRTRQKARTRAALVGAARELLAEGARPTVEGAADRAGISRTTAYRYFPNQRALVLATYPHLDAPSLLGDDPPADALARLELTMERLAHQLVEYEPELRAQLRLSLEAVAHDADDFVLRQGRAVRWFEEALAPLRGRLSPAELHRLAIAIRATFGIESLVWLTDVARLSREDAVDVMRSSARAIFDAATAADRTRT